MAVVAGATRGAGRGIAAALGEAGATVYCTGRSSRVTPLPSDYDRPETIEETAELVTSLGGEGIAVAVDHLDPAQVEALADAGARPSRAALDVLVNDIWGAELLKGGPAEWDTPIWELDLDAGLRILRLAIDTHLITSHHLLPLLVERPGGLVVEVTDGTTDYNADEYRISVFYDLAKVSVNRLAFSQGHELARVDGTAVAITPGFLRSEMMLEAFGVREENWREFTGPPDFMVSESPRYVGPRRRRARRRPERARWNQRSVTSGELAEAYGFTDVDGSQPQVWRYIADSAAPTPPPTPTRTADAASPSALGTASAPSHATSYAVGSDRLAGVHFEREHDFAGTVERVADDHERPGVPDGARPARPGPARRGRARGRRPAHRLTLRYEYIGQLDPIAQKVVGGRKLTLGAGPAHRRGDRRRARSGSRPTASAVGPTATRP